LVHRVHDAAGAVVAGSDMGFGGGSPSTTATGQSFTNGTPSVGSPLPAPRADATPGTGAGTTYIMGGFDGTHPDASVLATTDGRTFSRVGELAVPVRYAAVAAAGGYIYVFGGESVRPASSAAPVADIQRVDPVAHKVAIVGQLPYALDGAAA